MFTIKGRVWILIGILVAAAFAGCAEDATVPLDDGNGGGGGLSRADSIAAHWMQALADSLENLPDPEDAEPEEYKDVDYSVIRTGMNAALAEDANSRVAHLGSGILDVIEVNYDTELWTFLDSLIAYTDEDEENWPLRFGPGGWTRGGLFLQRGSPILGNQFTLLATAPRELARRSLTGIPANLSIGRAQEILEDIVMPALTSALGHIETAEGDGGPNIYVQVEDEEYEIDLGEILVFDASLHAALAALQIVTAYDVDLFDAGDSYGWVDDMRDIDFCDDYGYTEPFGEHLKLIHIEHEREGAAVGSLLVSIIQHNLEERPGFLTLREARMDDAYQNLLDARDKLEAAVESIRSEDDDDGQENDIIQILDLIEMDDDIASGDDKPRFAENFDSVEDVLDWIETVLTGEFDVDEEGEHGDIEFTINLSALFTNAPNDWRDYLPYHQFNLPADWISWEMEISEHDAWVGEEWCWDICPNGWECSTDIDQVEWHNYRSNFEPIELLDDNLQPFEWDDHPFPYFPDWTFGGLFPNATEDTWRDVAEAAGWGDDGP